MSLEAFLPCATATIAAATTSVDTVLPATASAVLITNATSAVAFVRLGTSGVVATTADTPVQAGARLLLRTQSTVTDIAVVLSSGSGTVYATSGNGSSY